MMELETYFTVSQQTKLLFWTILLGFPLGLCFDLFRTVRLLVPHGKWATALEDVCFLLVWGGALLCFASIFARGEMRGYYILGTLLGFLLYRCTIGVCVVPLLRRILNRIAKIAAFFLRPVFYGIARICGYLKRKFGHIAEVSVKRVVFLHFRLNRDRKMLYNKEERKVQDGQEVWQVWHKKKKVEKAAAGSSGSSAERR